LTVDSTSPQSGQSSQEERPNEQLLQVGAIVLGEYRVLEQVGEGGFGRVYAATHLGSGRKVALKLGRRPEHDDRIVREARLAAMLTSPHAVRVLGVEHLEGGCPFIVMEFLQGVSLREYLACHGKVEPNLAITWILELACALHEAHGIGLIHRDLKPSNLFLADVAGGRSQLKLLDFGLARPAERGGEWSVTGNELVVGSPAYMSPEQVRAGEMTSRTDIWSLGVVLHEMLAGKRPFRASTSAGILAAISADPPEPLTEACPGLPPHLVEVVEGCLRKLPSDRLASADEVATRLREVLRSSAGAASALGEESCTRTVSAELLPAVRPKVPARARAWAALALGLVSVLGALGALGLSSTERDVHSTTRISPPGEAGEASAAIVASGVAPAGSDPALAPLPPAFAEGRSSPASSIVSSFQASGGAARATGAKRRPAADSESASAAELPARSGAAVDRPFFAEPDF
jgi:serine/threonine protein kinase